jgi:hypothetical protein
MSRQKFHHLKGSIDSDTAQNCFDQLKNTIDWNEGIKSKGRHTRYAFGTNLQRLFDVLLKDFPEVVSAIETTISEYSIRKLCAGVYINYYKDKDDWTPNHTHPGTTQIIISLGGFRKFLYGKKEIVSENGDIIVFGSGSHGVPKSEIPTEGRISIALFMAQF